MYHRAINHEIRKAISDDRHIRMELENESLRLLNQHNLVKYMTLTKNPLKKQNLRSVQDWDTIINNQGERYIDFYITDMPMLQPIEKVDKGIKKVATVKTKAVAKKPKKGGMGHPRSRYIDEDKLKGIVRKMLERRKGRLHGILMNKK